MCMAKIGSFYASPDPFLSGSARDTYTVSQDLSSPRVFSSSIWHDQAKHQKKTAGHSTFRPSKTWWVIRRLDIEEKVGLGFRAQVIYSVLVHSVRGIPSENTQQSKDKDDKDVCMKVCVRGRVRTRVSQSEDPGVYHEAKRTSSRSEGDTWGDNVLKFWSRTSLLKNMNRFNTGISCWPNSLKPYGVQQQITKWRYIHTHNNLLKRLR